MPGWDFQKLRRFLHTLRGREVQQCQRGVLHCVSREHILDGRRRYQRKRLHRLPGRIYYAHRHRFHVVFGLPLCRWDFQKRRRFLHNLPSRNVQYKYRFRVSRASGFTSNSGSSSCECPAGSSKSGSTCTCGYILDDHWRVQRELRAPVEPVRQDPTHSPARARPLLLCPPPGPSLPLSQMRLISPIRVVQAPSVMPIKDGVSIPRNDVGAVKQGSAVTFGSIDDVSAPISSSPAAAPAIKSDTAPISSSTSSAAASTSSTPPTSTPATPVKPLKMDVRMFFQTASTSAPPSQPENSFPSLRPSNLPPQQPRQQQNQSQPPSQPSQLGAHGYNPSVPQGGMRPPSQQNSGTSGSGGPRSPVYPRQQMANGNGPRPPNGPNGPGGPLQMPPGLSYIKLLRSHLVD
ncbi:hypothetical protein B0H16DRAFT_1773793 [Mycena metata]|uniref:Uncharacterized protein n=1 Tax=Mycena metata TaxID=1033252 RepID=A0AAD7MU58_9AGAR|nr:hypothetical protein B0H16DRAFT_1773793 [Mycena metata]